MIAKTLLTAAALVAFGFTTSAYAAPANAVADDDSSFSVRIQVGDLDLLNALGAKAALGRIQFAAEDICGGRPDIRLPAELATYRACMKATVDQAVASLGNPLVAALNSTPKLTLAVATAPR
jgi:UrcA family protein